MRRGVSTSLIRSSVELIDMLPEAELYELGFFKPADLEVVVDFLKRRARPFGVHAPFILSYDSHPSPTSLDPEKRGRTFSVNEICAHIARTLGAEYMVIHFPTAHQDEDWRILWNEVVAHVVKLSRIVRIRVENVYGNACFHSADDFRFFLTEAGVGMCVDIGHLLLDSEVYGFDPINFIERLSEFIEEFHIYYADPISYIKCHHAPWGERKIFREILEFIRSFDVDFVLEATPECEGLDKLLSYWRGLG